MNIAQRKARIKRGLDRAGKSQNALARELGISHAYMSAIVNGTRRPSLPLAFKLQAATGIPAEEFVETVAA